MESLIKVLQNPAWQYPLIGGFAALLVALLVLLWRRRRRTDGQDDPVDGKWELVTAYGQVFPSFLFILNCYRQEHDLRSLFEKPEVAAALSRLESLYESGEAKRRGSSILLFPVPAARSSQVKASLLTILRGVLEEGQSSKPLPPQALQEMDRFLDSLTK